MSNVRNYGETTPETCPQDVANTFRWGLRDAAHGKGFDPRIETAHETVQRNYEEGRLAAAYLIALGLRPKWWARQSVATIYARVKRGLIETP